MLFSFSQYVLIGALNTGFPSSSVSLSHQNYGVMLLSLTSLHLRVELWDDVIISHVTGSKVHIQSWLIEYVKNQTLGIESLVFGFKT